MSNVMSEAAMHYRQTGELKPIQYNWVYLLHLCQEGLMADNKFVILQVQEEQTTKRNKAKILKEKDAPLGLIIRDDAFSLERYYPYAPARFDIMELGKFAAKKFNEMTAADLESAGVMFEEKPASADVVREAIGDIVHKRGFDQ